MNHPHYHTGFTIIEVVIVIVVVWLLGLAGWLFWHIHSGQVADAKLTERINSGTVTAIEAPQNEATLEASKTWDLVKKQTVVLPEWGVEFTMPASQVSHVVGAYDSTLNDYRFVRNDIASTPTCAAYVKNTLLPGVYIGRNKANDEYEGDTDSDKPVNFGQYYDAHKAKDGDYFIEKAGGYTYKVWKVSGAYYTTGLSPDASHDDMAAFAAACPQISAEYGQSIYDAMSTLKVVQ